MQRVQAFRTATALGGAASYSPAAVSCKDIKRITGVYTADQAGTFELYQCIGDNGTTYVKTHSVALSANAVTAFEYNLMTDWFKIVFVNGATPQGSFSLVAYLNYE